MIPSIYKRLFPGLQHDLTAAVIQLESDRYNCIMHVIGGRFPNIWPIEQRPITKNTENTEVFWPTDLPSDASLDNFIEFFKKFKYEVCDDGNYEEDYRKIAIFCKDDTVTHAALMHRQDLWTSKMGYGPVIRHKLSSLENGPYGNVCCFMKRPKSITKELDISVIRSYLK